MEPMDEEGSGLANRIIQKINELVRWVTDQSKADGAWKSEAEVRFAQIEREMRVLKAENKGLKISKGKAAAARRRAEAKLEQARHMLH